MFDIALQLGHPFRDHDFALEMGRGLAGFDFAEVIHGKLDGRPVAELFQPFAHFQGGPDRSGQGVSLAALEVFGVVGEDFLAGQFPALGLDFEAGGILIAVAQFDDGLGDAPQGAELAEGGWVQFQALGGRGGRRNGRPGRRPGDR